MITYKNRERESQVRYQKRILLFLVTVAIIICGCLAGTILTNAHGNTTEEPMYFTYYTEYEVEYGESLWSIASGIEMDDMTTKEIVKELQSINQIKNDLIYAGDIIIIPYISNEFK